VQRLAVDPGHQRPARVLAAQQEVRHLRDHVGVVDLTQVGDAREVKDLGVLDGTLEHREVGARHARVLDLGERPGVGVAEELLVDLEVLFGGVVGEVVRVRLDAVHQPGRHVAGQRHAVAQEELRHDRRGRPQRPPHVPVEHALGLLLRRMVVDDHLGQAPVRQRRVAEARLRVDHREQVALLVVHLGCRHDLDRERAEHGPVLRAAQDPPEDDARLHVEVALVDLAHPHGRREGVGVRIVVDLDQRRPSAPHRIEETQQALVPALGDRHLRPIKSQRSRTP
jgi:hypothetical protein